MTGASANGTSATIDHLVAMSEAPAKADIIDSAWAGKQGAVCALSLGASEGVSFHLPLLADFDEALKHIDRFRDQIRGHLEHQQERVERRVHSDSPHKPALPEQAE
jgi:hypothetical protein